MRILTPMGPRRSAKRHPSVADHLFVQGMPQEKLYIDTLSGVKEISRVGILCSRYGRTAV